MGGFAEDPPLPPASPEGEEEPSPRELQLQNNVAFFEQLAAIQTQAHRQLRQAQASASHSVQADRKTRDVKRQIATILANCSSNNTAALAPNSGSSRRLNRRLLTRMNVGQLQVVLNFFLSQIETLNEDLVEGYRPFIFGHYGYGALI